MHDQVPARLAPMRIAITHLADTGHGLSDLLVARGHVVSRHRGGKALARFLPDPELDLLVLVTRRCGPPVADAVAMASQRGLEGQIVVVSDRIGDNDSRGLLAAGVAGLVIGRDAAQTLPATLEAVRAGQLCVPRRHASEVLRPGLSTREKQVIGLVALGFSNAAIADRLFLAESTVKSHLSSAFGKLGVRSRHEAVDLIVNPAFGLARGIMSLGAEPIEAEEPPAAAEAS